MARQGGSCIGSGRSCPWNDDGVPLQFCRCSAGSPPASELVAALLEEYDVIAGRALSGGPSATPSDFSPPGGVFVVGFLDGVPACCGGVKALGDGTGELKRMYVVPEFRERGFARALIRALEDAARDLGHRVMRLDSTSSTWPIYEGAGYHKIPDYNDNPHADFWGEKRL